MPSEPSTKRAIAFVDGQSLFHAAREAFWALVPQLRPQEARRGALLRTELAADPDAVLHGRARRDGSQHSYLSGHEKGIDVRIALDVVRLALDGAYDVAVIFSQDQDLSGRGVASGLSAVFRARGRITANIVAFATLD